jgi:alkaline phosphatase D
VPFTTLWNGDAQADAWPAFEKERRSLLDALSTVPNSYILSGDRHEFAAVEHRVEQSSKILEISTSPFSMFWLPLPQKLKIRAQSRRVILDHNGSESQQDSHWLPEEILLKYVAKGNHKW